MTPNQHDMRTRPRWRVPHTKIVVPRVPAGFIGREPLRCLLDKAGEVPVTLVCAPAGYGKTLLLADWVTAASTADTAWMSLDGGDNDPRRFWSGVLSAIGECDAVAADSPLRDLVPPTESDIGEFLADLVNALDAAPRRLCLVLDDVHEVVDNATLHGIAILIRHRPHGLRLVLSGRSDPPLPLARLRVQGQLAELRASDLAFSEADAAELLRAAGATLRPDEVHRVVEQTDGWAAGLRLAARFLRDVADRTAFLDDFAGNDRAVADYLVGEVLTGLPQSTRELLQVVSVCDEVSPPLAEVLSGRDDAGTILDSLERENALVMAVGDERRWYRIHPLLHAYLRADLDRQRPELAAGLHGAAAAWFVSVNQVQRALDHAARSDDSRPVLELLRLHAVALVLTGDAHLVSRALGMLGADAVARDRWLTLISALVHLHAYELDAAEADLAACAPRPGRHGDGDLVPLRALIATSYTLARGRAPIAHLPEQREIAATAPDPGLQAWARLNAGLILLRSGDRHEAWRELEQAQQLAREHGLDHLVQLARTALGLLAALDGDIATMDAACSEALALAHVHGGSRAPWLITDHVILGYARLMRLDPAGAAEESAKAGANADSPATSPLRYLSGLIAGAAEFDAGRRSAGLRLMRRARTELGDLGLPREVVAAAALVEYRCALRLAQDSLAREVAAWAHDKISGTAESALMTAWIRFAHDDLPATEQALAAVLDGSRPVLAPVTRLEGRLLEAAVAIHSGRRTKARNALYYAVTLAEPAGLIRPFEEADPAVRQLLVDQIGGFAASDAFATRVRRSLSDNAGRRGDGVLTEREHVVLARLTSQRSLDEVAVDLAVSVNTVKTHVRAIYTKLGVNNRRAAVVAARERGLTS